jgi:hypothetical protein
VTDLPSSSHRHIEHLDATLFQTESSGYPRKLPPKRMLVSGYEIAIRWGAGLPHLHAHAGHAPPGATGRHSPSV